MDNSKFPYMLQRLCFKELWDKSPDNMFVVRRKYGEFFIDAANPAQKDAVIALDSEIEGMPLSSLMDKSLYERFSSNYNSCLDMRSPVRYEESFLNHEGRYRHYETTLFPVFSDEGEEYVYGVCKEITALREAELELSLLKQKAEESSRSKISFLANMSHEMRTPLNGISSAVSLFLESSDPSEKQSLANIINSSVESLSRITNDVLDFARLNSGILRLELSEFKFQELVQHVFQIVTPMISGKNISLSCSISDEIPEAFFGDTIRIGQIMINLISNAIKFTNHGEVRVYACVIGADAGYAKVEISVRDTGIGIHEKDIPCLFQPFSQIDSSSTRKYQGAGLGLAISRQLAEIMGGYITVKSSMGQGSTFKVMLPLKTCIPVITTRSESIPAAKKNTPIFEDMPAPVENKHEQAETRGTVLVVEDNRVNSMVASRILNKGGFESICVFNGEEAVDYCKKQTVDAILMDWHMPVMDGLEATRIIRSLPGCFSLPIIGLTANALKEHIDLCINAGMNDVITKPIDREQMISMINYWIGKTWK